MAFRQHQLLPTSHPQMMPCCPLDIGAAIRKGTAEDGSQGCHLTAAPALGEALLIDPAFMGAGIIEETGRREVYLERVRVDCFLMAAEAAA